MRKGLVTVLAGVLIIAAAWKRSQAQSPPAPEQRSNAINLVRLINTAEARYHEARGVYGTFAELAEAGILTTEAQTPFFQRLGLKNVDTKNPQIPIPGFELRLVVSKQGDRYQIKVAQAGGVPHWAAFSDEAGLIFQGEPLK